LSFTGKHETPVVRAGAALAGPDDRSVVIPWEESDDMMLSFTGNHETPVVRAGAALAGPDDRSVVFPWEESDDMILSFTGKHDTPVVRGGWPLQGRTTGVSSFPVVLFDRSRRGFELCGQFHVPNPRPIFFCGIGVRRQSAEKIFET